MSVDKITPVLDHGTIHLVDHMGSDLAIARNARVSYDAAWRAGNDTGSDTRLIRYLYKHKHNTPFECVTFTFEVKAPIFVLRQWMRHRTWSYNEVSARYTELPAVAYLPDESDITTQSSDNKQMRTDETHRYAEAMRELMRTSAAQSFAAYETLLSFNCPRELARTVLPVSTYSHMFCTVNLHNLFRFLSERLHPSAQYEIRVYAKAILDIIKPIVPVATGAFIEGLSSEYDV